MLEIIQNSLIINKTIFLAVSNTESIAADSNSINSDKEISNEYKIYSLLFNKPYAIWNGIIMRDYSWISNNL